MPPPKANIFECFVLVGGTDFGQIRRFSLVGKGVIHRVGPSPPHSLSASWLWIRRELQAAAPASFLLFQHLPVLAVALLPIMMGVNSLSETVSKLPMKFFLKISCLGHSYRKLTKTPPKQRLIPRLLWHPCMAILFFSSSAKRVAQIPPLSTFIQPAFIFHETLEIHFFFSTSPLVNVNIGKLNVSLPRLKMRMVSDV